MVNKIFVIFLIFVIGIGITLFFVKYKKVIFSILGLTVAASTGVFFFYGGIIEITKAEHLDEDRVFISDIYNETYKLDGVWSETIFDKEYVRVTFEKNLSSGNDITVYPRVISGDPRIEVYEENRFVLIAEFTSIVGNEYNKVFLENLTGIQHIFDLRVVGGSLQFDHIIDPQASPNGEVDLKTQECGKSDSTTQFSYLLACDGSYPAVCGNTNDHTSCNDGITELQALGNNQFGGVELAWYNETVTDCASIIDVLMCYEWWIEVGASVDTCSIDVDANNGTSYTQVTSTCPGTAVNPGIICTNVTATEGWNCQNFFGTNETARAKVRNNARRPGGGSADNLQTDLLSFNVTYALAVADNAGPVVTNIKLNASTDENVTEDNLTVFFDVTDAENDNTFNVTDWRIGNISIALVNMPFNTNVTNSTGSVRDYSTYGNNATLHNQTTYISEGCKVGGCYDFDGDSDIIDFEDEVVFPAEQGFSFSIWVFDTQGDATNVVMDRTLPTAELVQIFTSSGIDISCRLRGDDNLGLTTATFLGQHATSTWEHYVCVRDPGSDQIFWYKNGTLVVSVTDDTSGPITPVIRLGDDVGLTLGWQGKLDEFMVFNRSLTPAQILEIYNAGFENRSIDTIVSNETVVGDNWTVSVTSSDLFNDSLPVRSTNLEILAGAPADTCSYTGGDWIVSCSDNCVITSNVVIDGGSSVFITGEGTFCVDGANITGYDNFDAIGVSPTQMCIVDSFNGGNIEK